jgi:hypothetical protein
MRWRSDASLARCRAGTPSLAAGARSRSASISARNVGAVSSHWRETPARRALEQHLRKPDRVLAQMVEAARGARRCAFHRDPSRVDSNA